MRRQTGSLHQVVGADEMEMASEQLAPCKLGQSLRSSVKETSEAKLPFDANNPSTYKVISASSRTMRLLEAVRRN